MLALCVRSLDLYDGWIAALAGEGRADRIPPRRHAGDRARRGPRAATLRGGSSRCVARAGGGRAPGSAARARGRRIARRSTRLRRRAAARAGTGAIGGAARRVVRRRRASSASIAAATTVLVDLGPERDALEADAVVLAAGAWTSRIHGVRTPPLRPVRGQLLIHRGDMTGVTAILRPPTILWGPDCYIVPRERELMIGATVEDAGFDERPTDEGRARLLDAARTLLPGLSRRRRRRRPRRPPPGDARRNAGDRCRSRRARHLPRVRTLPERHPPRADHRRTDR